jgi:hypothetical protein
MPGIDNEFKPEHAETLPTANIVAHIRPTARTSLRLFVAVGDDGLNILTPALITFFTISLDPRPKGA